MAETSGVKDKRGVYFLVPWQSVKSFTANNDLSYAASLAYYSLFAMIPLLLLLFFVMSFFITSSTAVMERITVLLEQFIPHYSGTILKEVSALARHKGVWRVLSIIAFIWASMPLITTLRTAFFAIFKVQERPSYIKTRLFNIGIVLLTLTVLVIASLSGMVLDRFLPAEGRVFLYSAASFFITVIMMFVFYFVFAPAKVPVQYIFTGALVTTSLWAGMRPLFKLFLTYNPHYGVAFGSLKAIFIVVIWLYYSFSVLLFGAEVIANLRRKDVLLLRGLFYETHREKDGLKAIRRFGRTYSKGEVIFSEGESGAEMFYLMSGSVRLIKKGQTIRIMEKTKH